MPIPKTYLEIADDLAARIAAGEYPPGKMIPSYAHIADIYSVSVSTAQRAVRVLQHERHLVVGASGRGVFVVEPTADPPISGG